MRVLSLFDGISCARVALERVGFLVDAYYASEIDKYTIAISQNNYSDIEQVGDVKELHGCDFKDIDLLIGGSPCQDLSIAKKNRQGLDGARSGLFWEYVRILKEVKPRYFILENVNSMPKEAREVITKTLGVEPIMINASLVSAQNRKRLFWTNIQGVTLPEDRGILLKDILENGDTDRLKSYAIDANYYKGGKIGGSHQSSKRNYTIRLGNIGSNAQAHRVYSPDGKSVALSALGGGQGAKTGLYMIQKARGFNKGGIKALDGKTPTLSSHSWEQNNKLVENFIVRKLTPIECERLQGLPDNYTEGVSNTQRYKALGNAFNADVIAHILSFIKERV